MTIEKKFIVIVGQSNGVRMCPYLQDIMPEYVIENCAKGGTSVSEWQKGGNLYNNFVETVNFKKSSGYTLSGVCVYQGERDSYEELIYKRWAELTWNFINDFMIDTDSFGVRICVAQIGKLPTDRPRPYWRNIQYQQVLVIQNYYNFKLVRTSSVFPYYPTPGPHYPASSYQQISKLFKQSLLEN